MTSVDSQVPLAILKAAAQVEAYFENRGVMVWKLGNIRSALTNNKDTLRMDQLQKLCEEGVVTMCFEMDGGFHVTFDQVGGVQVAMREVNTIRDGLDKFMEQRDLAEVLA